MALGVDAHALAVAAQADEPPVRAVAVEDDQARPAGAVELGEGFRRGRPGESGGQAVGREGDDGGLGVEIVAHRVPAHDTEIGRSVENGQDLNGAVSEQPACVCDRVGRGQLLAARGDRGGDGEGSEVVPRADVRRSRSLAHCRRG